jgi:hypothetical protein
MSVQLNRFSSDSSVYRGSRNFAAVASDRRADGAERYVLVERSRVLIERRVRGIAMRIDIATSAYHGIGLSLTPTPSGGTCYKLTLVHRDTDLDVELYAALHDRDILAEWQGWAAYLALPRLLEREPGRFQNAMTQIGATTIGPRQKLRRRGAVLSKRRPRIRMRRRVPGRGPTRVLTGAREIISYE